MTHTANPTAAPRAGCPPWCTRHDDEYDQHCSAYRYPGEYPAARVGVALRQAAGMPAPTLYVGGVAIDTGPCAQASCMAELMRRLGRGDIAAAIGELAAAAGYEAG